MKTKGFKLFGKRSSLHSVSIEYIGYSMVVRIQTLDKQRFSFICSDQLKEIMEEEMDMCLSKRKTRF